MSTSNRFKKGIENAAKNTEDRVSDNVLDNRVESIIQNRVENILEKADSEILKKVSEVSKKERGKNHSIYLSVDVENALKALCKATNKSKSALVNEILREILIK